jgi:hypothetical protein
MVHHRLIGHEILELDIVTRELHPEKARKLPGPGLGAILQVSLQRRLSPDHQSTLRVLP